MMPGGKNGFKVYNERTIKLPVTLEPVGVKVSVIIGPLHGLLYLGWSCSSTSIP